MVVYESLWGNTAAVARAIADGLGPGTRVGSTGDISPSVAATASLLVVGAPVHSRSIPTLETLASVAARPTGPGDMPADVDHPLTRDWIAELLYSDGEAVAFDTRIAGPAGQGGTNTLERLLKSRGRRVVAEAGAFLVTNYRQIERTPSTLREGELAKAHEWGTRLATQYWNSPTLYR